AGPVQGSIRPPGSKSLTNRALVCAAFADGRSRLTGALQSDDTHVMIEALRQIGIQVASSADGCLLEVDGAGGAATRSDRAARHELFIGNSGTTIRFLTAALSAYGGRYRLSGVPRMHERPIGDLVQALAPVCEGTIGCESPGGCPPVIIETSGWRDGDLRVAGSVSSQYLSGLMMAVPIARRAVEIRVVGELVSRPYVEMTARLMRDFGANVQWKDGDSPSPLVCQIDGSQGYAPRDYAIEPDASAASYFWAAAAITRGRVAVEGLNAQAMQGDVAFVDCLERMGCHVTREHDRIVVQADGELRGIDIDMNAISDTVQTLSVVALFVQGPTRIRGVAHNRFKETDRIGDLARELRKLGADVSEHEDGLTVHPLKNASGFENGSGAGAGGDFQGAVLETYDDHRMAMSLALAGLRLPGVKISNPACTAKTYPNYFADLERLTGRSHRWQTAEMS
ncbi:MAG: 3-phosphoshikimate 1-carboxyvinyltransferase, partial [Planctomycetaceae bacterium]